ncbi:MAG: hypothetical protein IT260_10290 [Saprospiraceae bacterium]|nr:hypothetical protein [Saprospiraceae bacterium]
MIHPTGQFPNETYLNGLRDDPESTLAVLYDEFRQPAIRAVTGLGGSSADGAVFFQAAVNETARLARENRIPAEVPVFFLLKALSQAHFLDWLDQRGQPQPEAPTEMSAQPEWQSLLPEPGALRQTRQKMLAWKQVQLLDASCREVLLAPTEPDETPEAADTRHQHCTEQYLDRLKTAGALALDNELPGWPMAVLRDRAGYAVWLRTQQLERDWAMGKPPVPESNRIWRWAIAALLLVAVGYGAFQFYFRPVTAAEVFADNFAPPGSLMDDFEKRYGAEMGNDSVSARPNECVRLLREADLYYRAKEYQAALDPLLLIVLDSSSFCQSDAWYFLGVIQLQLEDPTTAIQCFAKIEDLNRYGEDLYWYQSLAFVQLAKENPLMRDKARRAIERTLGNTRDSLRRIQAENMLKKLSQ